MASRFVRPDTAVLSITRGESLIVRRRLTAGEQLDQYARQLRTDDGGKFKSNPLQSGLALITAYLLDWTLTDEHGPVGIRDKSIADLEAIVLSLDYASFVEIKDAIEQHEDAMNAERAAEKNAPDGESGSSATSPSPVGVAGESSGSVN